MPKIYRPIHSIPRTPRSPTHYQQSAASYGPTTSRIQSAQQLATHPQRSTTAVAAVRCPVVHPLDCPLTTDHCSHGRESRSQRPASQRRGVCRGPVRVARQIGTASGRASGELPNVEPQQLASVSCLLVAGRHRREGNGRSGIRGLCGERRGPMANRPTLRSLARINRTTRR